MTWFEKDLKDQLWGPFSNWKNYSELLLIIYKSTGPM